MNNKKKLSVAVDLANGVKEEILCSAQLSEVASRYSDWLAKFGKLLEDKNKENFSDNNLNLALSKYLPEEYIAELKALETRLLKQKLSTNQIKIKTYLCLFSMILGLVRCNIENIWLGSIQAPIINSELEQATKLLNNNCIDAAAILAGIAIEKSLIALCTKSSIPILRRGANKMNSDLVKAGVYNQKIHNKINYLMNIRHTFAHPHNKSGKYSRSDVENMIKDVYEFLQDYQQK